MPLMIVNISSGNVLEQAITLANSDPDFCRHITSLGHNELKLTYTLLQRAIL